MHVVGLASKPGANVAQIARETGVAHNLVFKNEGRISRRLPATIAPTSSPVLLPVEVISDPTQSDEQSSATCQPPSLNASSCCVEFRHGKMTLENPSPELLAVLLRELTGRSQ
ncbi:MAG: IS66 family insertion sequence element accessory protein TnpB [Citrobacter sp.]